MKSALRLRTKFANCARLLPKDVERSAEPQDGRLSDCSTPTDVTLLTSLFIALWASSPNISEEFLLVYGIVRAKMHMPRVGEQVYVDELSAVFVVAWVDDETKTVDLVPSTGSAPREEYVPWQKLFSCRPSPNERASDLQDYVADKNSPPKDIFSSEALV
jgi:hypothetical protein